MKIRIIGCSDSGKTYFAKRLSEKYVVFIKMKEEIYKILND